MRYDHKLQSLAVELNFEVGQEHYELVSLFSGVIHLAQN